MSEKTIPLLNHGFVRLVDTMGDDQRIIDAARISYSNTPKSAKSGDEALINYLWEQAHTSPFEQVILTFHAKMPIFVARQWVRHRTARLNEVSGRYSIMKDEFYVPDEVHMTKQHAVRKQGGSDEIIAEPWVHQQAMQDSQRAAYESYIKHIDAGLARETSRINLPLSLYTEWYWQIDLHNLFNFLRLRLDSHAQYEIRVYAEAMAKFAKELCPMAWGAFERYTLNSRKLCSVSLEHVHALISTLTPEQLKTFESNLRQDERMTSKGDRKIDALKETLGINLVA